MSEDKTKIDLLNASSTNMLLNGSTVDKDTTNDCSINLLQNNNDEEKELPAEPDIELGASGVNKKPDIVDQE